MATRKPLRIKKLSPKTTLPVLREDQIDHSEYESLTTENQIVTGVESHEEREYHLQAALKGTGQSTDNEIPVPPPQDSGAHYDELYPTRYVEPRNYIKFSDTVEETLGCLYDMTTEDEEYLKTYNATQKPIAQLSEDDFERIMYLFELTALERAPFASVDNTVVSYEAMVEHMVHTPVVKVQAHTKQVYEYWKNRRQASTNKPLHASLKFETHQENDDLDPYVCFRRREVRQTRKTRARDVQIADRLKKLRKELEDGRLLVILSHQRELLKKQHLKTERSLFEHRAKLKTKKVRLGIKADEEDLYNTKPAKRPKISDVQTQARGAPHTQLRLTVRPDGRPVEQELVQLSDKREEQETEFRREIELKIQNHKHWNQNHVDLTDRPLSPVREDIEASFRPAKAQFLPTPPASADDSMDIDSEPANHDTALKSLPPSVSVFRGATPEPALMPLYRRRIGRNGRQYIDRRPARLASPPSDAETPQNDRFKYDQDDSDDDDQPCYPVDPFSTDAMAFRGRIPLTTFHPRYPGHRQIQDANAAAVAGAVNRPALPHTIQPSPGQIHQQAPQQQVHQQQPAS